MANALLLLAKGKGLGGMPAKSKDKAAPSEPIEDEDDGIAVGKEELSAMKAFDAAATPEERAKALKAFIKLCEGY